MIVIFSCLAGTPNVTIVEKYTRYELNNQWCSYLKLRLP